jgi:LEA14-like dessication related protein
MIFVFFGFDLGLIRPSSSTKSYYKNRRYTTSNIFWGWNRPLVLCGSIVYPRELEDKERGRMKKSLCLLIVIFLAFGGSALYGALKDDLQISLEARQIQDLSLSGLSLVFYARITNTSRSDYYLTGYEYRFVVNQTEYIRLATALENRIKIDAAGRTMLSFPMKITYAHLFQAVEGIAEEEKAQCYLTGTMAFSDARRERGKLPFAFSGEFPIFKKPEIEFLSLLVNDLTIGGADLNFKVRFQNRNGFELVVDRISYRIELEDKLIGEGEINGDKNIGSHSDKDFSLPLLLNFYEVGKDVSAHLRQPSSLCRFFGELKVRTIWGGLEISFDKKERVSLSRIP